MRLGIFLMMVGRREWAWADLDATLARLHLHDAVLEFGYFNHQDLPVFYSAAEMLVFPSLWEGFGLPVVEAMACGCPVITSNLTCLPEVAGGAALLVDPYSVADLAQAIQRVLSDTALRESLRARGLVALGGNLRTALRTILYVKTETSPRQTGGAFAVRSTRARRGVHLAAHGSADPRGLRTYAGITLNVCGLQGVCRV